MTVTVYDRYDEGVKAPGQEALRLSPHDESVIRYYLPKNEIAADLADFYAVFGDATRVRILSALAISEQCVTDLCRMLGQIQSTVSHQLALLRALRLVKTRRVGKIVYYSLANKYVLKVLEMGIAFLGY